MSINPRLRRLAARVARLMHRVGWRGLRTQDVLYIWSDYLDSGRPTAKYAQDVCAMVGQEEPDSYDYVSMPAHVRPPRLVQP